MAGVKPLGVALMVCAMVMTVAASSDPVPVRFRNEQEQSQVAQILSDMGFSTVAMHMLSSPDFLVGRKGPFTLFSPAEPAFHRDPEDVPRQFSLSAHVARGLYTYNRLQTLRNSTAIVGIAGHVITVTAETTGRTLANGVEISHPDLFNDGLLVIHAVQDILPALWSDDDDSDDQNATAEAPSEEDEEEHQYHHRHHRHGYHAISPHMLRNAALSLRNRGYSVLALAMRIKAPELLQLRNMTVFALNDDDVFMPGGQSFVNTVRYHVVPNIRLKKTALKALPSGTSLQTLVDGRKLHVTIGNKRSKTKLSVNCVQVKSFDVYANKWIAVHEVTSPFVYPPPSHCESPSSCPRDQQSPSHSVLSPVSETAA